MIFDIKNKITDKEYKDIMEKLAIKHDEEDKDTYELRYILKTTDLSQETSNNTRDIVWRMRDTLKIKKVKIENCINTNNCINNIIEKQNGFFDDIDIDGYNYEISKKDGIRYLIKGVPYINEWLENYNSRDVDEDDDDKGIYLVYKNIIPIHIKKL